MYLTLNWYYGLQHCYTTQRNEVSIFMNTYSENQNTLLQTNKYQKMLVSFFAVFKIDKTINPIQYIMSNIDIHDETVPDYIPFLINYNNSDYLLDIMLWDYYELQSL